MKQAAWKNGILKESCTDQHVTAPGFAQGAGGARGYRFSEDQAQRIFEDLFGSGFGGLGGGMGGGMGGMGGMGGRPGGPRVRVFNSGPGGAGPGKTPG